LSASKSSAPLWRIQQDAVHAPYIGSLWNQLEYLIVANDTGVDSSNGVRNFAFEIIQQIGNQPAQVYQDPRTNVMTELERIWGGPIKRYSANAATVLPSSTSVDTSRICPTLLENRWNPGTGCALYDSSSTDSIPLLQFGVGMWPNVCDTTRSGRCGNLIAPASSFIPFTAIAQPITNFATQVTINTETWTP
jgi:hypothetical protein